MLHFRRIQRALVLLAVVFTFDCQLVLGQAQTGEILGVVYDSTGAAVPGAMVTVMDTDTGLNRTLKTDGQGRYDAADLQIGNYQVQAEGQGFAPQVQKGLSLAVGQKIVSDFKLQVGAFTQEVTVTSTAAPQINTTSSETGGLINSQQMQDLPLNGRNYSQLIALTPGVQPIQSQSSGANFGAQQKFSVAGGRMEGASVLLDGVEIKSFWGQGGGLSVMGTSLGIEAIAEFQEMTSTFNAQYNGLSVVNEVTRSGTNKLHGSAYGYFRNSAMDARGFFDPGTGPPAFHRNQFGGALGGAIKKNKTFFFVNYEGFRATLALYDSESLPDANAHAGLLPCVDLSKTKFTACAYPTNPGTLENVGTAFPTAFATAQPFLALYPVPPGANEVTTTVQVTPPGGGTPVTYTNVPTGVVNQTLTGGEPQTENYLAAKLDHQITSNNSFSFRYVFDSGFETNPWPNGGSLSAPGEYPNLGSFEHIPERNQYYTLQDRHTFSANLVNVASVSFVRTNQEESDDLTGAPPILTFLSGRPMGSITITGVASIGVSSYLPLKWIQNVFTEQDEIDWVHGAHTLKFGGLVSRFQCACEQVASPGLAFAFSAFAGGPASGLEAFLEATPQTLTGPLPGFDNAYRHARQTDISAFIQDDWKVTRRLTLNLGLRDDFITNPTEAQGLLYRITNLVTSTGYTHEPNMFQNNPSTKNIDPRVGLAWDIFGDHKTSFRSGFGIFHSIIYPRDYLLGMDFAYPYAQGSQTLPANFPNTANLGLFSQASPAGRAQTPWNMCCTQYLQEWNATVERQLPGATSVSLGYVGSAGVHLRALQEANTNLATNILPNGIQVRCGAGYTDAPCTPSGPVAVRTNLNFSALGELVPETNSHYNGMILSVKRTLGNGIQFQSGFTWSRCIDWGSQTNGADLNSDKEFWVTPIPAKSYNKGPCAFNVGKNWTSNALLPLPFRGNQLKEGWQVSLIASVRTGSPVSAIISYDGSNLGAGNFIQASERPDVNPNPTGPLYERVVTVSSTTHVASAVQLFNPTYFQQPQPGYAGNAGRDSITGPGFFNGDISLLKNTKIPKLGESTSFQIRADVFNVLNHTNFQLPSGTVFTSSTAGAYNIAGTQSTAILGTARQLQFSARMVF